MPQQSQSHESSGCHELARKLCPRVPSFPEAACKVHQPRQGTFQATSPFVGSQPTGATAWPWMCLLSRPIMHTQHQWTARLLGKQPSRRVQARRQSNMSCQLARRDHISSRQYTRHPVRNGSLTILGKTAGHICAEDPHHQLELGRLLPAPLVRRPGPRTPGGHCWELGGRGQGGLG